jgi:signal transduction histidine kinase
VEPIAILLIEDNPGDARLLKETLREAGLDATVEVRETVGSGLQYLSSNAVDLILLDLSLPDAHGMEAFSKVNAEVPHVPIVMLTGNDDQQTGVRAVNEGAQDYLVKGRVPPEALARAIRYAIERHRMVAELRRLDTLKTRFIADAAHELRQPLATLAGYAHLLTVRRDAMTSEQQERAFQALERQSEHINTLIGNLLDLSQIEQQHLTLHLTPVELRAAVDRALEVAPAPPGKSVDVLVQSGVDVIADVGRLDQVLINLLTNAYRYGGDNVTVESRTTTTTAELSVADDGEGVPENLVARMFEPFARGSNTGNVTGSGLGLAIVRKIVAAFGGDVSYRDNEPHGAKFVLKLTRG